MQKAYVRQNFVNGTDPALDEVDMNKIDSGLSEVDDRVILLDGSKADKTQVFACVNSIIYTISTGILRITYISGAVQDVNLGLNNVALSMSPLGVITMQNSEGNTYTCDLREIINSDLAELGDVNITDPEEGQVLKYNAETGKWENGEGGLGSAVSYEAQTLTDPQKTQARTNINAAGKIASPTTDNLIVQTASGDIADSGIAKSVIPNEIATRNVVGAKNLLPFPYRYNTQTINGVSFTVNADGSVTVVSDGTNTGADFYLFNYTDHNNAPQPLWRKAILSGCDGGSENTYCFIVQYIPTSWDMVYTDEFVLRDTDDFHSVRIRVSASTVLNKTFYPMIRVATDTNNTYEPYAQTNRQLTANKVNTSAIAPTEDGATASKAYVVGETFFRGGDYCTCIQAIASGGSFILNTNYKITSVSVKMQIVRKRIESQTDASGQMFVGSNIIPLMFQMDSSNNYPYVLINDTINNVYLRVINTDWGTTYQAFANLPIKGTLYYLVL